MTYKLQNELRTLNSQQTYKVYLFLLVYCMFNAQIVEALQFPIQMIMSKNLLKAWSAMSGRIRSK